MTRRGFGVALVFLAVFPVSAGDRLGQARTAGQIHTLTFEERVAAQEAIERVYYSHQTGATIPFVQAVPRELLERKVRTYLKETVALEVYWHTPITSEMLRREEERITRGTRLPSRLRELRAALGDDRFLFEECVARAALVDRLARRFFASDQILHAASRGEAEALREDLLARRLDPSLEDPRRTVVEDAPSTVVEGGTGQPEGSFPSFDRPEGAVGPIEVGLDAFLVRVPLAKSAGRSRVATYSVRKRTWDDWWTEVSPALDEARVRPAASEREAAPIPETSCPPYDTWDNGSLDNVPEPLARATSVWTGTLMIVWSQSVGWKYDPATDSWDPVSKKGAPMASGGHTAVWTGSRMIVWGADTSPLTIAAGRYDPVADSWTPVSTTDAPSARQLHTAVWTGKRMIVWGGVGASGETDTGGSYDPQTDTWAALSTNNAPSARVADTAVWTGTQMIVWGGWKGYRSTNTGGRYDPITDTWSATTTTGAPSGGSSVQYRHTAVWTGNRMIVWGGGTNMGGVYDPVADRWTSTSTVGAPSARFWNTAISTGSKMIVWGGWYGLNSGGMYDPRTNTWSPIALVNAPSGRQGHTAVWTGSLMIVWGGSGAATGGRYAPDTDSWTPTYAGPIVGRSNHTAIWTGSLMIIWGGLIRTDPYYTNTGSRYDPLLDTWSVVSTAGAPSARWHHSAVWTGTRLVVWGGQSLTSGRLGDNLGDGGRYDPTADRWEPVSMDAAPLPRALHTAVWTGTEMLVWGGDNVTVVLNTGGRYDPVTDRWRPMRRVGAPAGRSGHTAVWTGQRMVVWGGSAMATGGRYDPATDTWSATPTTGAPSARSQHTAVWTGSRMIVWGGWYGLNSGGMYDPRTDTWSPTSLLNAPSARANHTAVWTESLMIVWGGGWPINTGAVYDPIGDTWSATTTEGAPGPRPGHSSVWADGMMIVWGGGDLASGGRYVPDGSADHDGDGFTRCGGDCDDGSPSAYPGAVEMCNGVDNDCDGVVDSGVDADLDGFDACRDCDDASPTVFPGAVDVCDGLDNDCDGVVDNPSPEVCDGVDNDCNGNVDDVVTAPPSRLTALNFVRKDTFLWDETSNTRGYDIVRGNLGALESSGGDFTSSLDACVENASPVDTLWTEAASPTTRNGWYYLVRALGCPVNGTYDDGAQQGTRDPEIAASPNACP